MAAGIPKKRAFAERARQRKRSKSLNVPLTMDTLNLKFAYASENAPYCGCYRRRAQSRKPCPRVKDKERTETTARCSPLLQNTMGSDASRASEPRTRGHTKSAPHGPVQGDRAYWMASWAVAIRSTGHDQVQNKRRKK